MLVFFLRSKIILAVLTVASLAVVFATTSRVTTAFPSHPQEQALDPLTPQEMALAAEVANADQRVKEAVGPGRQLLVQVQFLALKDARMSRDAERLDIGRHAAVIFYRYDGDQGIHVVVDLQKRAVLTVTRIEGRAVPLAPAEVTQAFELAAKDERVRALLGSRLSQFRVANLTEGERPEDRVEGLRVVATSPRDRCYRHRCVDLLFHTSEGYVAGTTVTVDLTAQSVRAERTSQ